MATYQATCNQLESLLGGRLKSEWFETVRASVDCANLSEAERLNVIFALFLEADMNVIGRGSFPAGLQVSQSFK